MRAFYFTHKHIRAFVFGVPEGWHTGVYDLQKKKWTQMNGFLHGTLRDAKAAAEKQIVELIGTKLNGVTWH